MKIRKLAFSTFQLSFKNVDVVTDPLLSIEAGDKVATTSAEAVVFLGSENYAKQDILSTAGFEKIRSEKRDGVVEISAPGDFEIGGVMIRRELGGDYYTFSEDRTTAMYIGRPSGKFNIDAYKNLGDIDLLMLPIGDGGVFYEYEVLEKIIGLIDPSYILPHSYRAEKIGQNWESLKGVDEFVKHFGYTHIREEKVLKVVSGDDSESKAAELVIFK